MTRAAGVNVAGEEWRGGSKKRKIQGGTMRIRLGAHMTRGARREDARAAERTRLSACDAEYSADSGSTSGRTRRLGVIGDSSAVGSEQGASVVPRSSHPPP